MASLARYGRPAVRRRGAARTARTGRGAAALPGRHDRPAVRDGADPRLRPGRADRHLLRLFYVVSGIAAAVGNTVVGWAMDTGEHDRAPWLPWACCLAFGLVSAAGVAWLHRLRALPAGRRGGGRPATAAGRRHAHDAHEPRDNLLTDNPELYEARFPDADRLAGRWAEDCLRRHGAGARVLDIGCGTGRDAAHLHAAGRTVAGADLSEAMLAYARTHHPGPEYVRADLRDFDLGTGRCSTPSSAWTARCCTATPTTSSTASSPPAAAPWRPAGCSSRRCATARSSSAAPNCSTARPSTASPGRAPPTGRPPRCASTAPPNSCAVPACGRPTTAPRRSCSTPHGGCCSPRNCAMSSPRTASRSSTCTTGPARAPNRPGRRARSAARTDAGPAPPRRRAAPTRPLPPAHRQHTARKPMYDGPPLPRPAPPRLPRRRRRRRRTRRARPRRLLQARHRRLTPPTAAARPGAAGGCAPPSPAAAPARPSTRTWPTSSPTPPAPRPSSTSSPTTAPTSPPNRGSPRRGSRTPDLDRWTVKLRKASFHNGKPVTARDVLYSYRRIADPKKAFRAKASLEPIDLEASRAVDERTVEFVLKRPTAEFPNVLAAFGAYIVPENGAGRTSTASRSAAAPSASSPSRPDGPPSSGATTTTGRARRTWTSWSSWSPTRSPRASTPCSAARSSTPTS